MKKKYHKTYIFFLSYIFYLYKFKVEWREVQKKRNIVLLNSNKISFSEKKTYKRIVFANTSN